MGAGPAPIYEVQVSIECGATSAQLGSTTGRLIGASGYSLTQDMQIRIPSEFQGRNDCRLKATVDPRNLIAESNETNNEFSSATLHIR